MGKRLTVQRRGKGSPVFLSPSHKYVGKASHVSMKTAGKGKVTNLLHCAGHTAPLMTVKWDNGEEQLTIAPEGVRVNQTIECGTENTETGATLALKNIPEGTLVYNIEGIPGVDVVNVKYLNAEILAPSIKPGRLTIFTEAAIEKIAKEKLFA